MTTYTFDEVSAKASRNLKCACGRRFKRSTTITNTVSPFNRDPETGEPRTFAQVAKVVREKAAEWQPNDHARTCPACGALAEVVESKEKTA